MSPRVGPSGPRVLVVGCIHGDECAGLPVIRALGARTRAPTCGSSRTSTRTATRGTRGRTRAASTSTATGPRSGWRRRPAGVVYAPGPRPFSERETRIARNLILRLRSTRDDLVPPAHGRRLGLGREHGRGPAVRARRDAPLPPPVAPRGTAIHWQNPRPAALGVLLFDARGPGREPSRPAESAAGAPPCSPSRGRGAGLTEPRTASAGRPRSNPA